MINLKHSALLDNKLAKTQWEKEYEKFRSDCKRISCNN